MIVGLSGKWWRNSRELAAPLGASRRARAGELLESRDKARSSSTTAAGRRHAVRSATAVLYASGATAVHQPRVQVGRSSADSIVRG